MTWGDETDAEREFADLGTFVRWLAATYRRQLGHGTWWCASWRQHPEAVSRLDALWRAYEQLHAKPLGLADWWLHYCDPTMRALMADTGPFRDCDTQRCTQPPELPITDE